MIKLPGEWHDIFEIPSKNYTCGYCGENIASEKGYPTNSTIYEPQSNIYICHHCNRPTFIDYTGNQYPGSAYGISVNNIESADVSNLYNEARSCVSCGAYTASALCSRKLLMNISVSKGAKEGLNFIEYIKFLSDNGYIPPGGNDWVDHIRKKGNEATHEISIMTREDAEELIDFIEMLLKFIFEFPARMKSKISKK